jgi:hypothetical protein
LNPVPVIFSAAPDIVEAGTTTSIVIKGGYFVPGAVVLVDGVDAATTFNSPSMLTVKLAVAASSANFLVLQIRNPGPGGV